MNRKKLTQLAALSVALLGGASSALAVDMIENVTEYGHYSLRDGTISALVWVEAAGVSITTYPDDPGVEDRHIVVLAGSCHENLPFFRVQKDLSFGDTFEYLCPQEPDSDTLWYTIQYATALLGDAEGGEPVDPAEPELPQSEAP